MSSAQPDSIQKIITSLIAEEVQDFIVQNEHADVGALLLKKKVLHGVSAEWIAHQIQGRKKIKEKLPRWYNTRGIVYPPSLHLEQSSSEETAAVKCEGLRGKRAADLTGGFGVDSYFLSTVFEHIDYVEPDGKLLAIAAHNHAILGAGNIRHHHTTAEKFLQSATASFDLLFVDPSRRTAARKVFQLKDSLPDVVALKSILLQKAPRVLVKSSPLLDLKHASREMEGIEKFTVVSVNNECRELLLWMGGKEVLDPLIEALDITRNATRTSISFTWAEEKAAVVRFAAPQSYLYEPHAALMKAGAFRLLAQKFNVGKLAADTHLYTSLLPVNDFPGRVFKIVEQISLDKKLKTRFEGGYANILRRNHPLSVADIKKKTGLREGGIHYLICTRTDKPVAFLAERLK
ncbi:MAG: SAM-dependent methyltransferase [Cytophagales bacterium]|nr:SAM-dependent methyltransferase [Cytophagales bacterium]